MTIICSILIELIGRRKNLKLDLFQCSGLLYLRILQEKWIHAVKSTRQSTGSTLPSYSLLSGPKTIVRQSRTLRIVSLQPREPSHMAAPDMSPRKTSEWFLMHACHKADYAGWRTTGMLTLFPHDLSVSDERCLASAHSRVYSALLDEGKRAPAGPFLEPFNMLPIAFLSLLAGLFATAEGAPHERRDSAPSGFVLTSSVPPTDILPFRLALTPQDFSGLERTLYSVSTPGDAQYGKHLSLEEVQKFTTPASATLDAITSFLSAHNLTQTRLSNGKNWLNVNMTAGDANMLFGANYSVFTHQETGEKVIRTLEYSIPQELEGHVQVVHPGTTFPQHIKRSKPKAIPSPPPTATSNHSTRANLPSSCNENMTPACLLELYSIPTALAPSKDSRLVVTSYEEEYKFLQQYRSDLDPSTTFTLQTVAGGKNPQDPNGIGAEGTLDIQMTVGLASGIPVTLLATGESNLLDPVGFINSMDALLAESNPPQVVTISYGWDEDSIAPALASTICNSFAQVGARGVSILVASGDGGVSGGHANTSCTSSDPFLPVFPGTCPFVTAVGSTIYNNETAAYFSSGGFSNVFATPSYQSSSPYVSNYLKTLGNTYKGRYNASGRAFPDVATIGDYVAIVYEGIDQQEGGTSCSAPMFASVVALLNSELLAAGKSVLGFLNPLLWSGKFDGALNDVTTGSNPGCGSNGFSAGAGWDPVTGFGTPNYPKMKAALGL
ncbi:hypothetical protein EVG20_g7447 [Dentipellis fragilis]|uniref:Peptidase S53 domain-containing protein n=1 Tax=Dentipellis fragilis TaxID=205917 RepID=A0A4Y9YCT4_9AGAM|nr:hypothetical protein EVG20_g7447 [Dentipellis fragilis]